MNLAALASILVNIIGPIILVASLGFALSRAFAIDSRHLSRTALYLFTPALVFTSAYRSKLGGELAAIATFVLLVTALVGLVTLILGRALRLERMTMSAFALSTLFVNAGNYGMPVNLFAFGEEGLARAVGYFVVSQVLAQTLAVFIAARGSSGVREALLNVVKMPLIYAVVLGLALNRAGVAVPEPLIKTADLVAAATVPCMLVVLGMELARARWDGEHKLLALAVVIRLAIAPVLALGLAALLGLTGLTRTVLVLEASMPTAVTVSILAVEFKCRPEFVAGAVLATTVGSVVSLTLLLGFLQ